jgi:nucleoid DNA-binding protein
MNHDATDPYKKPMNRMHTITCLARATGLSTEQVGELFDALVGLVKRTLIEGQGVFTIPGLLKLKVVHKPATADCGGSHYNTKQNAFFKAKPARNVITMMPSTALYEAVN